jgi:hypothetical protein
MTDEFLTEGLQDDRYLKALRLYKQFENEIKARLRVFDQRMVDKHPDLFDSDPSLNTNRTPGSGLAIHRINHQMNGPKAPDNLNQRLNVHLYWMPPTEYDRTDIDGALRAFGYKVKGADETVDDWVVEQTQVGDWPLETSGNPYDSNITFYRHVSSAAEVEETMNLLVNHFEEFGDAYERDP